MDRVWVDSRFRTACAALGLHSVAAFARFFGVQAPAAQRTVLHRSGSLPMPDGSPLAVHYKQYDYPGASWRFVGRSSKARREFRNYAALERIGIPCAVPVACGEQRGPLHRLRRAFILTVSIPGAMALPEFVAAHCPDPSTGATVRSELCRQLAALTRQAHDSGFIHRDLFVRNVLVTSASPLHPQVWWIDSPRGTIHQWGFLRRRGIVSDLASLDKGGSSLCSRSERLRFLRQYADAHGPDPRLRKLVRRVLAYAKRRWPGYRPRPAPRASDAQ